MNKRTASFLLSAYVFPLTTFCTKQDCLRPQDRPIVDIDVSSNTSVPILKLTHCGKHAALYVFSNGVTRTSSLQTAIVEMDATRSLTTAPGQPLVQINTAEHTLLVYDTGHVKKIKEIPIGEITLSNKTWLLYIHGKIKPKL